MSRSVPTRWVARAGLAALSALALGAAGLAFAGNASADATGNPYSPAYQHGYRHGAVPTRQALADMGRFKAAHPLAAPAAGSGQLHYGGAVDGIGVTTGKPKVYLVFFGSQWGTAGTDGNGNTTLSGD